MKNFPTGYSESIKDLQNGYKGLLVNSTNLQRDIQNIPGFNSVTGTNLFNSSIGSRIL